MMVLIMFIIVCSRRRNGVGDINHRIRAIISKDRRFVSRVKRSRVPYDEFYSEPLPSEIDNHADIICFGKNFRPIYFTSQVCSVSPFLDSYESRNDVPICTGITAVDLLDGSTVLLEAGQGSYFGDDLDHSLINPNQLRAHGIPVCDDPTDLHRSLSTDLGSIEIPMKMNGSICYFVSRCPTDSKLESCETFKISDENHWDPTENISFPLLVEMGKYTFNLTYPEIHAR